MAQLRTLSIVPLVLSLSVLAAGSLDAQKLTAWTTGEPNAPPDVAAVYRAVLDDIFPRGSEAPKLVVITQMTEPSMVEIDFEAKKPYRRPDAAIAPFEYRIPLVFADTNAFREMQEKGRAAEALAPTLPTTDPRHYQGYVAPFIERYPGAWGRVTFGRVGFGRDTSYALVEARFFALAPEGESGHEIFRLARTKSEWKVVDRIVRDYGIKAIPLPERMLHGWVDSSMIPPPKRSLARGTVKDSASGAPIARFVIRIESVPLDRKGFMIPEKFPEPWGTTVTNSTGAFSIKNPPAGYTVLHAECPPRGNVRGAILGTAVLQPESHLDTVIDFRVRFASCRELAPAMAAEAKQRLEDVKRAKVEAAARTVQGNVWGTVRDSRTGRPVRFVPIQIDGHWASGSDSRGHFWLWGFAPGKRRITVFCPLRRQMGGRVATSFTLEARPAMKDTTDISIDMEGCVDAPVDTVRVLTRGVWSIGFEDGFFTPCEPFNQIKLGAYIDKSKVAELTFAGSGITPPGGWPDIQPTDGYTKIFMVVEADLIGPGSYGHMGIALYQLRVARVLRAKAASKGSCGDFASPYVATANPPWFDTQ